MSSVSDALTSIIDAARRSAEQVSMISTAAERQFADSEKVVHAVEETAAGAEESASAADETSSSVTQMSANMQKVFHASQDLSKVASSLIEAVEQFRVETSKEVALADVQAP